MLPITAVSDVKHSPLGKTSEYTRDYSPQRLFAVPRAAGRQRLGIEGRLPFAGVDLWTAYELSWLNAKGKPVVAIGEFGVPADSPAIVESKSMKLYLNSLQGRRFESDRDVANLIAGDLGRVAGAEVAVTMHSLQTAANSMTSGWSGTCIDDLDIEVNDYRPDASLLHCEAGGSAPVRETLYSDLLKSNCPVTGQPDWASVMIRYAGPRIDRESLLRYLISFRETADFHEHCVERIFMDIKARCGADRLTVYARYTRRGGLDINPFRSDFEAAPQSCRLVRQ